MKVDVANCTDNEFLHSSVAFGAVNENVFFRGMFDPLVRWLPTGRRKVFRRTPGLFEVRKESLGLCLIDFSKGQCSNSG